MKHFSLAAFSFALFLAACGDDSSSVSADNPSSEVDSSSSIVSDDSKESSDSKSNEKVSSSSSVKKVESSSSEKPDSLPVRPQGTAVSCFRCKSMICSGRMTAHSAPSG